MSEPLRVVPDEPRRCAADGCRAPEVLLLPEADGAWRCWSHSIDRAQERQYARERGGLAIARRAAQRRGVDPDELPALDSLEAAREWLALIARWTATGRITSAQATAMTRAVQQWVDAEADLTLGSRLSAIERRLGLDGEDA